MHISPCVCKSVFCLPQLPEGNDLKFSHKIAISVLYEATLAWMEGGRGEGLVEGVLAHSIPS